MKIYKKYQAFLIPFLMLLGLLMGSGYFPLSQIFVQISDISSQIFMRLLQLVSLPIIFLSIMTTLTGLDHHETLKTIGVNVLRYTLITTISAASIALLVFLIIDPGHLTPSASSLIEVHSSNMGYQDYLLNIIPTNALQAFIDNNVIGTLLIAVGMGIASSSLPKSQKETLHNTFSSLYAAVFIITQWILKFIPIAIWAFTTQFTHEFFTQSLQMGLLGQYLLCVTLSNILQATLVLPLLLYLKGYHPKDIFFQALPALQIAFWSKSSSGALPAAIKCLDGEVDSKIIHISLPLCISINMNGCAAFILTTVFFVAKCHGIYFSPPEMLAWIFISTLTAVGNAGIPMGCYFLSCALLSAMNIPLDIMGYILPFYMMIDMLESAINVFSDICVTYAVAADQQPINKAESTNSTIG
jgi:Na+/H+-dicarboxylate symporter